jgi:hypothetical protein
MKRRRVELTHIVPQLVVSDITETLEYMGEKLGFAFMGYTWHRGRRAYCNVFRDTISIDLWQARYRRRFQRRRTLRPSDCDLDVWVEPIRSFYAEIRKRGARIFRPITKLPSGHITFVTTIPDGYRIRFLGHARRVAAQRHVRPKTGV